MTSSPSNMVFCHVYDCYFVINCYILHNFWSTTKTIEIKTLKWNTKYNKNIIISQNLAMHKPYTTTVLCQLSKVQEIHRRIGKDWEDALLSTLISFKINWIKYFCVCDCICKTLTRPLCFKEYKSFINSSSFIQSFKLIKYSCRSCTHIKSTH